MVQFVNFSTGTNKVFCVNFAADITWEVGNVKFNVLKYIFYHSLCRGVAMSAIVGMWLNAFMKKVSFYKKHGPR